MFCGEDTEATRTIMGLALPLSVINLAVDASIFAGTSVKHLDGGTCDELSFRHLARFILRCATPSSRLCDHSAHQRLHVQSTRPDSCHASHRHPRHNLPLCDARMWPYPTRLAEGRSHFKTPAAPKQGHRSATIAQPCSMLPIRLDGCSPPPMSAKRRGAVGTLVRLTCSTASPRCAR